MRRLLIAVALVIFASAVSADDSGYRYEGVRRVVAFADVHGAYTELVAALREAAVIDAALRWQGGTTHLVSLGDLVDRGPDSRKVLDLLMRLEDEARAAGGAVHVVLGNHEIMNIVGDLRYVSAEEYGAFAGNEDSALRDQAWLRVLAVEPAALRTEFEARFPAGYFAHRQAFSAEGRYGQWLRRKPFLIVIGDTAFVHGGLSPWVARLGLEVTNTRLHAQLDDYLRAWNGIEAEFRIVRPVGFQERPDHVAAQGGAAQAELLRVLQERELFTPAGPSWFRGQALCYRYTESENLGAALAALQVKRVVAGHTVSPIGKVLSRFDGRVILLDTGMLQPVYQGTASALVIEDGRTNVAYADRPGERSAPVVSTRAVGSRPKGLDDDALEHWLATAEVASIEELDAGITQPQRVTLRKDGVELRAVFKQLSTTYDDARGAKSSFDSDRFEYELAAYKLDRLIGLDMVPVAVPRTIGKRNGVLQFWIDDSMNLRHMIEQKLQPAGWCEALAQYNLMNVFDVLTENTDRTQENALFTRDWMLVLIDHSRAFSTRTQDPVLLYKGGVVVPPELAERLRALDRQTLQDALGAYLHRRQIDALLKRRDRLLSEYGVPAADRKIAAP